MKYNFYIKKLSDITTKIFENERLNSAETSIETIENIFSLIESQVYY